MNDQERAAFEAPRVTGAPDSIWLCYGDLEHDDTHAECCRQGEVTWCEDKQGPADVKYARANLAAAPVTCQTFGPGVAVPCAECNQVLVDVQELAELRERAAAPVQAVRALPETMSRDEALKHYSAHANLLAHEALEYQRRIRELEAQAALAAPQVAAGKEHANPQDIEHLGGIERAVAAERERCAAWVDARRSAFCEEHGSIDPDTGALEFGRGAHAEAKAEYVGELEEIAAGLRALGPNAEVSRAGTASAALPGCAEPAGKQKD